MFLVQAQRRRFPSHARTRRFQGDGDLIGLRHALLGEGVGRFDQTIADRALKRSYALF